jgi:phosphatidylethanolamine/phosphatidyl-N-methylethanolamine N-methyltransferase
MAFANAQPHESRLYYELSHLYDLLFRRVFYPRIAMLIRSLDIAPGARVLEVGVGTGLSLDEYPMWCQVTGIDLAPDMLERAQDKVDRRGWRHINLEQGDALNLRFADDSFDYVTAFHVVSVVPDPVRMMAEVQRVCRPGGVIAIINHFRSPSRIVGRLARTIDPITRWLGWTTLRLSDVLRTETLEVERQWKTSPRSLFTIVVARNRKGEGRTVPHRLPPGAHAGALEGLSGVAASTARTE